MNNDVLDTGEAAAEAAPSSPAFVPRQVIGLFVVPFGYEVWADGVYVREQDLPDALRVETPSVMVSCRPERRQYLRIVARRPVWITQFGQSIDADEEIVQIAFIPVDGGRAEYEWVERYTLAERRELIKLAARGIPVRTGNADRVEEYLDRALHENATNLPKIKLASRLGQHTDDLGVGWLVGQTWVGPPGSLVSLDPRRSHQILEGFRSQGTEQAWLEKFAEVQAISPLVRWLVYSTFAAPLLRLLGQRTFVIHHWSQSGGGKSAMLRFALSAWGDPAQLLGNFNRTRTSFIEVFAYMDSLPIAFDELQASTNDDHAHIIYALCLERGRGRATRSGGLQKQIENWRAMAYTNGEEPLIGNGKVDLGGQTNRVLQINAEALSGWQAEGLHRWLDQTGNFGWAGVKFLRNLVAVMRNVNGRVVLESKWSDLRDKILDAVNEPSLRARSGALGAIALASGMAQQVLLQRTPTEAYEAALSDGIYVARLIAADQADQPTVVEQALQLLRDHAEQFRRRWVDLKDANAAQTLGAKGYESLAGVENAGKNGDETWLVQSVANDVIRRAGMSPNRVWSDMRREGILKPGTGRGHSDIKKWGNFRNRVYVLEQSRFRPEG